MSLIDEYSKDELQQIVEISFSYAEVLSKLGYGTSHGNNYNLLKKRIQYYNISTQHFHRTAPKKNWSDEEIFCEDSKVSQHKLRDTFKERNFIEYKCAVCGLAPFWNGKPLVLTLDHKNGKNKDNRVGNLQWVCPNCDRQSDTYGSKNKKQREKGVVLHPGNYDHDCINYDHNCINKDNEQKKTVKIIIPERQELKDKLWELKNYTQVANYYNVSTRKVRDWCREYNLPAVTSVIKHTSEEGWKTENWNDIHNIKTMSKEQAMPCYMMDIITGEVVKEFSSREDSAQFLGKDHSAAAHIGAVCNGKRITAYGYKWSNA